MTPPVALPPPPTPTVPRPGPVPGVGLLLRTWLWGWMAIVQLIGDLMLAGPYLVIFGMILGGVSGAPAFGVGLPLLAVALLLAMLAARFERLRVHAFIGVVVQPATPPSPDQPLWRRLLLDGRVWRAGLHVTLIAFWGILVGTVTLVLTSTSIALAALPIYRPALPSDEISLPLGPPWSAGGFAWTIGLFGVLLLPLVARGLVGVDLALARWLLGPGSREQVHQLTERVETLNRTREATVDSVELERRRIERDLHDGPQQRLVAIAMDLGMARAKLTDDPEQAQELLDKAHTASKEAITEMRQVARGIHPPVLTDRGLDAALSALAARSPVPVTMNVQVPVRPGATIEAIAYFCVSEALTNVAKHAAARSARVDVLGFPDRLEVTVQDDGRGGADPAGGTGLSGLSQRLAAVDGTMAVYSPIGGPTTLRMVLPQGRVPRPAHNPRSLP